MISSYKKILTLSFLGIVSSSNLLAADIAVPGSYPNIQEAVNVAADNDNIVFSSNVTASNLTTAISKILTFKSANPAAPVTIASTVTGRNFIFNTGSSGSSFQNIILKLATNTTAPGYGGAIINNGQILDFVNTKFDSNRANNLGGAIYNNNGTVNINTLTQFINNSTVSVGTNGAGGAVYSTGTSAAVNIIGSLGSEILFSGNKATGKTASDEVSGSGGAISNTNGSVLTINYANFTNNESFYGGAIYNDAEMHINNSLFLNNKITSGGAVGFNALGGAIYNGSNGNAYLNNVTFDGNANSRTHSGAINNSGHMEITNSSFVNNSSSGWGGAINSGGFNKTLEYASLGTIIISDSDFYRNKSLNGGGALCNGDMGTVTVNNTSFRENQGMYGGGLYNEVTADVNGGSFVGNIGTSFGGAIYSATTWSIANEMILNINGVTFDDNRASNVAGTSYTNGGAIYLKMGNSTTDTPSAPPQNVYPQSNTTNIINSIFTNNIAKNGGVIYGEVVNDKPTTSTSVIDRKLIISIDDSDFSENIATEKGGVFYVSANYRDVANNKQGYADTTITNSSFDKNMASNIAASTQGGVIYNTVASVDGVESSFKLFNNDFTENKSSSIRLGNGTGTTTSTAYAGAIYNMGAILAKARIILQGENDFDGNYVEAISTNNSASQASVGATSNGYGGVIYNSAAGTIETTNPLIADIFQNNYVKSVSNSTGVSRSNSYGGVIFNTGANSTIDIGVNTQFLSNEARAESYANNTTSVNTSAFSIAYGGALYNESAGKINIADGVLFDSNKAIAIASATSLGTASTTETAQGGVIYNTGTNSEIIINGTTANKVIFSNNEVNGTSSSTGGGAIYNTSSGKITVKNTEFSTNSSDMHGGAIYNNATLNINGVAANDVTTFTGNTAGITGITVGNGGAIYNTGTTNIYGGTKFTGNSATGDGGAIYHNSATALVIDSTLGDITFTGNTADRGNDIYSNGRSTNINGTANTLSMDGGISGNGTINKSNDGTFIMSGDSLGFTGTFNATGGITTVTSAGKMFKGTNNVSNNALVNVYGDGVYYGMNVGNNGNFAHYNTTDTETTVSNIGTNRIVFTSTGGIATFDKDNSLTGNANYLLNTQMGLATSNALTNTVNFNRSNVRLGRNDYRGTTTYNTIYNFTNSDINLRRGLTLQNYEFDKFTTSNSTLSLGLILNNGVLTSDTLKVNSATTDTIGLGVIEFISENDAGLSDTYSTKVLTGSGGLQFDAGATSSFATLAYEYDVKTKVNTGTGLRTDIEIDAARAANEHSLNAMNIKNGSRGFYFNFFHDNTTDQTYNIGADLDQTANGTFVVNGFSLLDPSHSIISGEIVDNTGTPTGANGSFFKLVSPTDLTVKNLTIQDAYSTGNGSIINSTNTGAKATLENIIVQNNVSDGLGGAVYNSGILNLVDDVTFTGNTDSSGDNDIYNNNGTINIMGIAGKEVSLDGGISGTGTINKSSAGNLLVDGDSSGFIGTFNSTAGTSTFNSGFFNGLTKITNSIVTLSSTASVGSTSKIELGTGGVLNTASSFTLGDDKIKSTASGNGTYNKTAGTITITGDNSDFTGIFNQTGGSTIVNSGGKMFSGTNNISNSLLKVTDNEIGYSANLGNNGQLEHYSTTTDEIDISSSMGTTFTGTGASMLFDKDSSLTDNAVYKLVNRIDNGNANSVTFNNSDITLGSTDYTGATTYNFNNSLIDLTVDNVVDTYEFTNLNTTGSRLSFDLDFTIPSGGLGAIELGSDTLKVTNGSGTIGIGQIKITNDNDNGINGSYTTQVLDGLTFNNVSDTTFIATNVYEYEVSVNTTDRRFVDMTVVTFSDENSLNKMNIRPNLRGFNISTTNTTYYNAASLDLMANGEFIVQGFDTNDPSNTIYSGYLYQGGAVTTNRGSFFNMTGTTDFTMKNATFQDAYKVGNGSILSMTSNTSSALLSNLIIKNNEATANGGVIYHTAGALNISDVLFDSNKAANGGTIYNANGADIDMNINAEIDFFNTQNIVNAINGGAIYNTDNGTDLITRGTTSKKVNFTGLKATDGGAVYNTSNATFLSENTSFDSNIASGNGGAIYNNAGGGLTINAGTVFKNTQNAVNAINGGAIYNTGSGSTAVITGSAINAIDFTGLKATNGGAIYNNTSATTTVNGNVNFANNTATSNGGAIYNAGTLNLNTTDGNINFTNNNGVLGKDIYNDGGTININGTANTLTINGGISGTGSIIKSNNGNLIINSDETSYTGTFTATGGTTTINSTGKMFGGTNTVSGTGIVEVFSDIFDYNMNIGSGGTFKHHTTTTALQNVGGSSGILFTGTGGSIVFDKETSLATNAKYNLNTKIDNNNANTVTFNKSDVTFSNTDYTGGTTYNFTNSVIDLTSSANTIRDFEFDNLTTANSTLNFGISFEKSGDVVSLVSDTLTVNNANTTDSINLGIIKILQDFGSTDNGLNDTYQTTVLSGIKFSPATITQQIATTAYEYSASLVNGTSGQLTDLQLDVKKASDENSLNAMNIYEGHRGFNFTFFDNDTETYNIGGDLDTTAEGVFTVSGVSPAKSILSGAIVNNTGTLTGDNGSFFKVVNETQLTVQDLTIQEAYSSGNGSILTMDNADATAVLQNLTIDDNTSDVNGGAIYNQAGTLSVIGSTISNNKATTGLGGAIYNAGTLNLVSTVLNDVVFSNNIDSTGSNDIYNSGGTINIAGSSGLTSIDVIAGTGTINKINNGLLELNGDNSGFTGIFAQSGGTTTVYDKMFNGAHGISNGIFNWEDGATMSANTSLAIGTNATLNVNSNDDLEFDGNNVKALSSTSSGTINKNGTGTLDITGNYTHFTGDFYNAGGDITVTSGFFGGDSTIAGGNLELADGSFLATTGSIDISTEINMTTSGIISLHANQLTGAADFNKSDGILNINGNNSGLTGTFTQTGGITNVNDNFIFAESIIDNSTLNGAIDSPADLTLENSSTWNMSGTSELDNLTVDNSTIHFTGSGYHSLTVDNYNALNAQIYLNTFLGDDSSSTDKIVINGGTVTGTSVLFISGHGTGAKTINGIKIVDAQGGATIASNAFSLYGGKVDIGAFTYKLFQGNTDGSDTQSFFLRSMGISSGAKGIAQEPSIIINIMKTGMNSLSRRMGELRDSDPCTKEGLWVRTYGKSLKLDEFIDTDLDLYGFEAGYDHKVLGNRNDAVFVGAVAGYMTVDNIKSRADSRLVANGNGNAPSVGLYATWLNREGWFADATYRTFWEDLNNTTYFTDGSNLSYDPDRQITAFALESGKQVSFAEDKTSKYVLEPKLKVMYAWADAKNIDNAENSLIRFGLTESLTTKASIMLGYNRKLENGVIIEPYAQISGIQEWKGKTHIRYDEANFNSNLRGFSMEYGAGLNVQLDRTWSLYGDAMYEKGSVVESLSGNLGLRYSF